VLPLPCIRVLAGGDAGVYHHRLAQLPASDSLPQGSYLSGHVRSSPVGHFQLEAWPASPHKNVEVVEGTCPHAYQYLARARLWVKHIFIAQDVGGAVLVEA
jgi:hypothetical protein